MLIKAGSIQNLTDARYFASHEVDWIGFCFDAQSPRYISPREAQQIMAWVEGPGIVGEFGNQPLPEMLETAMIMGLNGIQFDGPASYPENKSLDHLAIVQISLTVSDGLEYLKQVTGDFNHLAYRPEYLLLDLNANFATWDDFVARSPLGINGLAQLAGEFPLMLATQFNAGNISSIMEQVKPAAIQLSGTMEEKTGEKAFDELEELFSFL